MTDIIIDGDVMVHIACKSRWQCAMRYRKIEKGHPDFSYKAPDDFEFTKEESAKYLQESYDNMMVHYDTILERYFEDFAYTYVKGDANFRDVQYPLYKANRIKVKKNEFIPKLRDLLVMEGKAEKAINKEADDLIRIRAELSRKAGRPFVVCSNDKDLKCIAGNHYNIKTNEAFSVTENEAVSFYYQQLLMGDPTDNIPGIIGLGPKTAKNIIDNCQNEEQMQDALIERYMDAYPDDWEKMLTLYGQLIHIQRTHTDVFSIKDWSLYKALKENTAEEDKEKIVINVPATLCNEPITTKIGKTSYTQQTLEYSPTDSSQVSKPIGIKGIKPPP